MFVNDSIFLNFLILPAIVFLSKKSFPLQDLIPGWLRVSAHSEREKITLGRCTMGHFSYLSTHALYTVLSDFFDYLTFGHYFLHIICHTILYCHLSLILRHIGAFSSNSKTGSHSLSFSLNPTLRARFPASRLPQVCAWPGVSASDQTSSASRCEFGF